MITGSSFDERPGKLSFVAVVDRIVRVQRRGDQVLGRQQILCAFDDVLHRNGVHVVNNRVTPNSHVMSTKILTKVSSYDLISKMSPGARRVEALIEPAHVVERWIGLRSS